MTTDVLAILRYTHAGLRPDTLPDFTVAQRRFREAERDLEILPLRLIDTAPEKRAYAIRAARGTYAQEATTLLDVTGASFPASQTTLGPAYARLLSDLLVGRHPDSRAFWSAVWCAPYALPVSEAMEESSE
jgi:hypothetical protein